MGLSPFYEAELRIQHRHTDGSWGEMEEQHHDAADHDPERTWARGKIFRCKSCEESVTINPGDPRDEGA